MSRAEFVRSYDGANYVYLANLPGFRREHFTVETLGGRPRSVLRVHCQPPALAGPSFFLDALVPDDANVDATHTYYADNMLTLSLPRLTRTAPQPPPPTRASIITATAAEPGSFGSSSWNGIPGRGSAPLATPSIPIPNWVDRPHLRPQLRPGSFGSSSCNGIPGRIPGRGSAPLATPLIPIQNYWFDRRRRRMRREMLRKRIEDEAEEMLRQRMEDEKKLKEKQEAEEMLRKRMEDEKKLKEADDSKFEFTDDGTDYALRITLRGFRKEDFSLIVDGRGKLVVRSKQPAASGRGFVKEFQLPSDSNSDGIRASFNDNGVLTVTVPKGVWIENATNYVLRINLEGFRKDDMTVQVDDDADNKISVLAQGPIDGGPRFFKEYPLPSKAILNDIHANFEAGVLAITAPKRPAAPAQTTIAETSKAKGKEHGESIDDPFDSDEEGNWIESATNYVLRIKLQGISKEDVRVQGNSKGGITVRGHFPDGGPCLFNESFLLPPTASLAGMSAIFGANILKVTVPKRTLPTLSPTAVEIRRPKAKEDQAWSWTREQQVDCAKPLPTKDDEERPKKEDVFKKASDKATRNAPREEKDEKEEPASRSKQDVVMRIKEETKPIVSEEAVPRPPNDDAINEKAKIIDQKSQVERLRRYCCCFGGRGSGLKQNMNI